MKTVKLSMIVALFIGSCHLGFAQDNSLPKFKSDAEKQAWIDANPDAYKQVAGTVKTVTKTVPVTTGKTMDLSAQPTAVRKAVPVRVNNTSKALPANYKPAVEETKP